jgi:hypothetical protein
MTLRRGLLALTAAGVMAFSLSGCFVIVSDTPSQQNLIGDVVVHTVACVSSGTNTDSCPDKGNSHDYFGDNGITTGQLLLAYRVPDGYGAPTQVKSTSGSPQLVLDANSSYADQLTSLAPPPAGEHWVGYMTGSVGPANNTEYTFETHFTRPPAQNGAPSNVPFRYLTVTGGREINSTLLVDRALNCGTTFTDLVNLGMPAIPVDGTTCVDSPAPVSSTELPPDTTLPTRDLAVAPGNASASRGTTVNVPFTLNYVGAADPGAVLALTSGVTGLAGATASPANASFAPPSNSSTVQNVAVKIPAAAKPGTYDVPFSAKMANGQTRQAVGKLTVLKDTSGPKLTISLAKTKLTKGASRGFGITVSCNEDCSVVATLTATSKALKAAKTVKLGQAKGKLAAAGRLRLTVKPNRSGKSKLKALARGHKRLKGKIVVVATDGAGNKTTSSKKVSSK